MDRELKEFLIAVEKTNDRMLTTLSRVLAADAGKADERTSRVVVAQHVVAKKVTDAVYISAWALSGVIAVATVAMLLWGR